MPSYLRPLGFTAGDVIVRVARLGGVTMFIAFGHCAYFENRIPTIAPYTQTFVILDGAVSLLEYANGYYLRSITGRHYRTSNEVPSLVELGVMLFRVVGAFLAVPATQLLKSEEPNLWAVG